VGEGWASAERIRVCPCGAGFDTFSGTMAKKLQEGACAKYELPAENLENLYNVFSGIQKALVQGNTQTAQKLCAVGQKQLRDVVICFD
jgi:hypothetical protein